ncbi:patatin-like phospholipase domain-containing protein 2 [Denticeps clupeoides]|uniref:triacylglycerol lipase n=1 Tax=Denticeps clupeoides TaxID=299321 RepID=A0A8C4B653_9TELE|nr:patatin-like phospholipase domain-containing protein 2 [Denticeps clupeoides]XP_028821013.1 patatin-like phospholipase domain-containing protein 2 [Denticeps clupeoides]
MLDLDGGWSLSFAGCGFLGVYHIGVASCLVEQAPQLVRGATRIYGASAGALTAAMLASGASIARCCEDVMEVAKEARRRNLGPLHPSFNLVKVMKGGLQRDFPDEAHLLTSDRLHVSLTRVSDGKNVLVSKFSSKDELIQALVCSCFIPVYCGLIPPSFRGVRYVDGGISDNLPQSARNTITVSPFSGESDICPRDNSSSFHELRFTNTSIQMNLGNACRLGRAFFPPEPKIMAEMCQNGYKDALRFLQENNLLRLQGPTAGPALSCAPPTCCCPGNSVEVTESTKEWVLRNLRLLRKQHWWLDEEIVNNLPGPIRKVFCEACREKHSLYAQVSGLLPVRLASYMLLPYTLPVESAYSAAQRFVEWIPEVPADIRWLFGVAGDVYRHTWGGATSDKVGVPMRKCISGPVALDVHGATAQRDPHLPFSAIDLRGYSPDFPDPAQQPPSPQNHSPKQICFFLGSADQEDG